MSARTKAAVSTTATMAVIGLVLPPAVLIQGCSSTNSAAYHATGTAVVTVDAAMTAWGDYVAKNHPGAAAEQKVKSAYETYQRSVSVVADAASGYLKAKAANDPAMPKLQAEFNNALAATGAALVDLTALIRSLGVKI